jgi:hypothetical protein
MPEFEGTTQIPTNLLIKVQYLEKLAHGTAIPIIIEGRFQVFQRFSSSNLVLKAVERCFVALNYYGNGSSTRYMKSKKSNCGCTKHQTTIYMYVYIYIYIYIYIHLTMLPCSNVELPRKLRTCWMSSEISPVCMHDVCMYVCVCVHELLVCACVCVSVCVRSLIGAQILKCKISPNSYRNRNRNRCIEWLCMCMYIHTYIHTYIHIYIYIYKYIYTYIRIYIHTYRLKTLF